MTNNKPENYLVQKINYTLPETDKIYGIMSSHYAHGRATAQRSISISIETATRLRLDKTSTTQPSNSKCNARVPYIM